MTTKPILKIVELEDNFYVAYTIIDGEIRGSLPFSGVKAMRYGSLENYATHLLALKLDAKQKCGRGGYIHEHLKALPKQGQIDNVQFEYDGYETMYRVVQGIHGGNAIQPVRVPTLKNIYTLEDALLKCNIN